MYSFGRVYLIAPQSIKSPLSSNCQYINSLCHYLHHHKELSKQSEKIISFLAPTVALNITIGPCIVFSFSFQKSYEAVS